MNRTTTATTTTIIITATTTITERAGEDGGFVSEELEVRFR
jgi:hypothetical protein